MSLGIAIVMAFLAGGPSAGPAPVSRPVSALAPAPADLRYTFPVGDVLVYERVFDTENSPIDHPGVSYTVHEEWLIKTAVVNRNGSTVGTAVQANRTKLHITGRAALVRASGRKRRRQYPAPSTSGPRRHPSAIGSSTSSGEA